MRRQSHVPPREVCVQIAVRTAQAEAGTLEEVAFMLFDQKTLDVWHAAAVAAGLQEEGGGGSGGGGGGEL